MFQFLNIALEITKLEALLCITIGSHCYNILKCINKLKENIYIFNETQQTKSLFYHFLNYKIEQTLFALSKENLKSVRTWWEYAIK